MRHFALFQLLAFCFLLHPISLQAQATDTTDTHLIVFMIAEAEYETRESLSAFAAKHVLPWATRAGYQYAFVFADTDDPNAFPDIEKVADADLLVLSVRRRTLQTEALAIVKSYLDAGKPLIAIRTSSHAFHLRNADPPDGHADWQQFDEEILGANYEGHFANDLHPIINTTPAASNHPIFEGIDKVNYTSPGSLYRSRNLASTTTVLLEGQIIDKNKSYTEPVAWTNAREGQKIFYTSLGHPGDFRQDAFQHMLLNALRWALAK